jgi:hypothetical protein
MHPVKAGRSQAPTAQKQKNGEKIKKGRRKKNE